MLVIAVIAIIVVIVVLKKKGKICKKKDQASNPKDERKRNYEVDPKISEDVAPKLIIDQEVGKHDSTKTEQELMLGKDSPKIQILMDKEKGSPSPLAKKHSSVISSHKNAEQDTVAIESDNMNDILRKISLSVPKKADSDGDQPDSDNETDQRRARPGVMSKQNTHLKVGGDNEKSFNEEFSQHDSEFSEA